MRKFLVTGLIAAGVAFGGAGSFATDAAEKSDAAMEQGASGISASDQEFMTKAAQGGILEVELGKLAEQQAASSEVKEFGQQMVEDHTKANQELTQLAAEKGVTLPQELDAEHRAKVDELSGMSGAEFDSMYMSELTEAHEKDIQLYEQQSAQGSDPQLTELAGETLPTLKEHLEEANSITEEMSTQNPS